MCQCGGGPAPDGVVSTHCVNAPPVCAPVRWKTASSPNAWMAGFWAEGTRTGAEFIGTAGVEACDVLRVWLYSLIEDQWRKRTDSHTPIPRSSLAARRIKVRTSPPNVFRLSQRAHNSSETPSNSTASPCFSPNCSKNKTSKECLYHPYWPWRAVALRRRALRAMKPVASS